SNLSISTWYRAEVQSGTCGNAYSDIAVVTVDAAVFAGTLSGAATVCASSNSGTITLAGTLGNVQDWESSIDGGTTWTSLGNTSATYGYSNLTSTTEYRVVVSNGTCGNDTSNVVTITLDPPVVGGTLSGSTTVCEGSNSGSLVLSGEVGNVIGWETSTDDGITWTNITNTTNTQNYSNLSISTWYRAEVQSGTCGNAYSDIAVVTVDAITNAGLLSGDSTVCYSSNTGTLTLSGTVGTTVAWQANNGSGWTTVATSGTSYTYAGLLDSTQYRFIAVNGTCGNDTSNTVTINVDPNLPPDAGMIVINNTSNTDTTVCAGSNTDTLRLVDMVGSVIHWEQSQDGGNTWITLANTDTFQVFLDLSTTTSYRAFVQGGACGIGYSDAAIVRVDGVSEGGVLAEDMVVCAGSNTDTLVLSGYVGDIVSWEIDSGLGYQALGIVGDSLIFSNMDTSTAYRVEVKNGVCPSVYSNSVTVSVTPTTIGGVLITGTSTVCEGDNSGTILLTNYVGNITRWEYSEDNGSTWIPMVETADSITFLNILRETQYRVFIQASGCPDVYSSVLTMLVYEPSVAGLLASDAVVCDSVHSGTLTLTGSLGSSIVWQSVDTGAVNDSLQLGGTSYNYANLTNTTRFIAIVTNGVCPPDSSNVVGVLTNFTEADFAFDNVCIGDEMVFADETFIKDGFAVQRNWNFGNGTGSTIEDPVVLFAEVGTYDVQLSIVSQGLCTDTIIQTVEVYPLPDSTITNLGDSAFCDGDSTILRGEDGLTYLWTTGDSTQFLTVTVEDIYGLTVTDSNLCVNSSEVFIEVWPLPQAEAGNDTTVSLGQTTVLNGSGGEEYMWDPPTFLDDFMLQNPLSSPDSTLQYTVLVTDSNGCQNTDSVLITVLIDYLFTPSNLVTPNGDGFNDTWFVENLEDYPECEVLIFNEFGEIVFQEREYDNDWAGDFQGARLPDGTYYYVITCPDAAALYKGHVTILSQQ
ncbi:MAG: gliding motility-associated C-terminal domain-containing protein, partial [Chitinophagales bacterium]